MLEGLLLTAYVAGTMGARLARINVWALIVVYIVVSLVGVILCRISDSPVISFVGYNLVVVPTGAILSVALYRIDPTLIVHAVLITAGVVMMMVVAAQMMPDVFFKMGNALLIALISTIVIEVIAAFAGWFRTGWLGAIIAAIFALYIGYDWSVAQESDHTLDGAVDACVDLYLDIINLFMRTVDLIGDD